MGVCCNGISVLCTAKIDIKDAIGLSYRILLNQQDFSSKNQNYAEKMMIELNWKLFVLSLTVIYPILPGGWGMTPH